MPVTASRKTTRQSRRPQNRGARSERNGPLGVALGPVGSPGPRCLALLSVEHPAAQERDVAVAERAAVAVQFHDDAERLRLARRPAHDPPGVREQDTWPRETRQSTERGCHGVETGGFDPQTSTR